VDAKASGNEFPSLIDEMKVLDQFAAIKESSINSKNRNVIRDQVIGRIRRLVTKRASPKFSLSEKQSKNWSRFNNIWRYLLVSYPNQFYELKQNQEPVRLNVLPSWQEICYLST
jgi:hypothetical protein